VKIVVGRRYRLRNGAVVKVINAREIPYRDVRTGELQSVSIFVGYFFGTNQKCSWHGDGKYSPVKGNRHDLDIVGRP
jgi:hypothetical protein